MRKASASGSSSRRTFRGLLPGLLTTPADTRTVDDYSSARCVRDAWSRHFGNFGRKARAMASAGSIARRSVDVDDSMGRCRLHNGGDPCIATCRCGLSEAFVGQQGTADADLVLRPETWWVRVHHLRVRAKNSWMANWGASRACGRRPPVGRRRAARTPRRCRCRGCAAPWRSRRGPRGADGTRARVPGCCPWWASRAWGSAG